MQSVPKRIKRLVREWAAIAHDRDLRKALSELGRNSRVGIVAKSIRSSSTILCIDSIRTLRGKYGRDTRRRTSSRRFAAGVLRKDELPAELVQHIAGLMAPTRLAPSCAGRARLCRARRAFGCNARTFVRRCVVRHVNPTEPELALQQTGRRAVSSSITGAGQSAVNGQLAKKLGLALRDAPEISFRLTRPN